MTSDTEYTAPEEYTKLPVEEAEKVGSSTDAAWTVFRFQFRDHQGYERRINVGCNGSSVVLASITEVGVFGADVLPFIGLATMSVDNVVPHNDGTLIVRGGIGWDTDLNARLHILVAS
jgi:hypothetical protein